MKDVKNYKYVKALWDCYQKGLNEIDEVSEEELFIRLIDDAVNQIVGAGGVSSVAALGSPVGSSGESAGLQDGVVKKIRDMIKYYGKKVDESISYKRFDRVIKFQHMKKALENLDEYVEHGSFMGES